jgi:hypothetical protein
VEISKKLPFFIKISKNLNLVGFFLTRPMTNEPLFYSKKEIATVGSGNEHIQLFYNSNGKEATVNRALDGSTYPG